MTLGESDAGLQPTADSRQPACGRQPVHIVKVGGSLLTLPDLPTRLVRAVPPSSDRLTVLVVGGGPTVDDLRRGFASGGISNEAAHWSAIARMSENAAGLARSMPGVSLLASLSECSRLRIGLAILDPLSDLQSDAGRTLPVGWHVTSDSIAAWCALRLGACELSLVKSVGSGGPVTVANAIRDGWLDKHFPALFHKLLAQGCRVRWLNLRHDPPTCAPLVT